MKRLICFSLLVMLVSACATIGTPSREVLNNRKNLEKLVRGIVKSTAINIMGPNYLESILIVNIPEEGEIVSTKDKKYEVLHYRINGNRLSPSVYDYTYHNTADNGIDDMIGFRDNYVPLVFDEDRLIGWGKKFLNRLGKSQK